MEQQAKDHLIEEQNRTIAEQGTTIAKLQDQLRQAHGLVSSTTSKDQ